MREVPVLLLILLPALAPAQDLVVGKDGSTLARQIQQWTAPASDRADFEYNTTGHVDGDASLAGSSTAWGEWFITTLRNEGEQPLRLLELSFPCSGLASDDRGWLVWTDVGGPNPPYGGPSSANYSGPFTPAVGSGQVPPATYSRVDLSGLNLVVPAGAWFSFGYDVTGLGGQVDFNGVETWSWFSGYWDSDAGWGRTAVLQLKGDYAPTAARETSWGRVKSLF